MSNIFEILTHAAFRHPKHPALTHQKGMRVRSLNYWQLFEEVQRVAQFLDAEGFKKGDRIIILSHNCIEWVALAYAAWLRGIVIVPLASESLPALIENVAAQTEASAIFVTMAYNGRLPDGVARYALEALFEYSARFTSRECRIESPHGGNDLAQIMFTSGTTGAPKGVEHTHANVIENLKAVDTIVPVTSDDRFLSILPLFHVFEQVVGLHLPILHGAHIVYLHRQSPAVILGLMRKYRITKMSAVPEFLRILMEGLEAGMEEKHIGGIFRAYRRCTSWIPSARVRFALWYLVHRKFGGHLTSLATGGAPFPTELQRKWEAMGVRVFQGYGLTEACVVVTSNTVHEVRAGTVGKPIPGVYVRIAQDGELQVRGPSVTRGYWRNPEATKTAFTEDGWYRTGDIAKKDDDDFISIVGRSKDMILGPGGENIIPSDLEEALVLQAGVKAACAIGIEDESKFQVVAVIIRDEEHAGEWHHDQVLRGANAMLASHQQMHAIVVWPNPQFPLTPIKKVKKFEVVQAVKQMLGASQEHVSVGSVTPDTTAIAAILNINPADLSPDDSLVGKFGLTSLARMQLAEVIGDRLRVNFDENFITPATTVNDIEQYVARLKTEGGGKRVTRHLVTWPSAKWAVALRPYCQWLFISLATPRVRVRLVNGERLEEGVAPLLMCNHVSYYDGLWIIKGLPWKWRGTLMFAAAEDYVFSGWKKWVGLSLFFELVFGAFRFPRDNKGNVREGLAQMGYHLDQGMRVAMFAEGQVNPTPGAPLMDFRGGAGTIPLQMGPVHVRPMRLKGVEQVIDPYGARPKAPGVVELVIGELVEVHFNDSPAAIQQKIREAILAL